MIYGVLAGTAAIITCGGFFARRRLKPKNIWTNMKTLEGCTVLITGGNSGIGAATARQLAHRKANVIIACRTREKSLDFIRETKIIMPESPEIKYFHIDLSSLQSINDFVDQLDVENIDILINNAGLWGSPMDKSADGLEITFATNYLSHFLLSNLLIKKYQLKKIINVSSGLYLQGKLDSADLLYLLDIPENANKKIYKQLYSTSKLAQIYHAKELAVQYPEIFSCSLHPGLVYTDLARYVKPKSFFISVLAKFLPFIIRTPDEGAQTSVYCSVEDGLQSGAYYGDCQMEKINDIANDPLVQKKLWDFSTEVIQSKIK